MKPGTGSEIVEGGGGEGGGGEGGHAQIDEA